MSLILASEANLANDFSDESPDLFCAILDQAYYDGIVDLAETLKEKGAYQISVLNPECDWLESKERLISPEELADERLRSTLKISSTELTTLYVMKDGFKFGAVPKHGSASEEFFSETFYFEAIDLDDEIYAA